MESSSKLAFLVFLFSIQLSALAFVPSSGKLETSESDDELEKLYELCPLNSTFTPNNTYGLNLDDLFTSLALSDTPIDNGFLNVSYGENPNQVNAVGLCRGDVSSNVCHSCIYEAIVELSELCTNQTEGIVWYDECMFRYSNRSIFGKMEFQPSHRLITAGNVSKVTKLVDEVLLTTLLDNLKTQAASGKSLGKFATGNASSSKGQTIYVLSQCTPDLSGKECEDCLSKAAESLLGSGVEEAARFMTPSCSIRYDYYMFYVDVDLPPLKLSPASPSDSPALPSDSPTPSPSPPVDEPPSPPPTYFDEPPPPTYFDEPPLSPPDDEAPPPWEFDAPPPPPLTAPDPPLELPDDPETGKGNMNSGFQALTMVPLVMIWKQFFAFWM